MLGNTLTINDGESRVLVKITQDHYSSEYMLRTSTLQYVAKIRHSETKATSLRPSYDRHNFEIVKIVFATDTTPEKRTKFYFVLEQEPSDDNVALADAACDLAIASSNAFLVSLLGWES